MKRLARAALRRAILFLALALGVLAQTAPALAQGAKRELHFVGVYEGPRKGGDPNDVRAIIPVEVDRPGASVVLVLTSYDAVRWRVHASTATKIESITLGGHRTERSEVRLGEEVYEKAVRKPDLPYAYESKGPAFRTIVETLPASFGLERISSFTGKYGAPAAGFTIPKTIAADPRLRPDYLASVVAKPASLPKISFPLALAGKPGLYSLTGEKIGDIAHVNDRRSAYVADLNLVYSFSNDGFTSRALQGGKQRTITPPVTLEEISWPTSATWDSKRNRLVGLTLGGEGFIYAYDLEKGAWSPSISLNNIDTDAIEYDRDTDRYIVAASQYSSAVELFSLSPDLKLSPLDKVPFANLPGYEDIGERTSVDMLYVDRRYIVLAAGFYEGARSPVSGERARIWLYDLKTRSAVLTWFKG